MTVPIYQHSYTYDFFSPRTHTCFFLFSCYSIRGTKYATSHICKYSREICISIYIHIGYEYVLLCVMYVYLFFYLFFALFFNSCPKFAVPDEHFSIVFPGKYAISSWCNPASPSTRFLSLQSCHQLDCPGLYGTTTGTPGHLF